jgi:hypothetical protein
MLRTFKYVATLLDSKDVEFLKNLKKYNYYSSDYELKKLNSTIEKAEKNLNK